MRPRREAPVAYILKMYPRFSETFILNELLELERLGVTLRIFSLREPDDGILHREVELVRGDVSYIRWQRVLAVARAHAKVFRRSPARYAKALLFALRRHRLASLKYFLKAGVIADHVQQEGVCHIHAHFASSAASVALDVHRLTGVPQLGSGSPASTTNLGCSFLWESRRRQGYEHGSRERGPADQVSPVRNLGVNAVRTISQRKDGVRHLESPLHRPEGARLPLFMRSFSRETALPLISEKYTRKIPQAHRFLFYSHDGLGLGHLRRNLSVATALAELSPKSSVLLATSADEAHRFTIPPGVDILALPGIRKIRNGTYAPRRLNTSLRHLQSVRASALLAAVDSFRPAVLLADRHPLGIGGELEPALERTRVTGGGAVLGLRDVLDDPATVDAELRDEGLYERIPEYYDQVLVYGQSDILDSCREYDFPNEVAAMTRFCGYVVSTGTEAMRKGGHGNVSARAESRPHVVATAGGGEDGFDLLATFVEAAAIAGWRADVVSGPHSNGTRSRKLQSLASKAGVAFQRFVPELAAGFPTFDALVCMGGYNTLTEAAASGVPTVCVPRVEPRTEQLIRARAFALRGLLSVIEPADLDAVSLSGRVEWVMARALAPRSIQPLDLGGAHRAARHLLEVAANPVRARAAAKGGRR